MRVETIGEVGADEDADEEFEANAEQDRVCDCAAYCVVLEGPVQEGALRVKRALAIDN